MWEEGSVPISVLLISVTMCEIARHSQLVCFNSVTGNNVCAPARVCVPHSGICSIRHMNLTWALRISAELVNTSHRPRREKWCKDEQSIFLVAYRENSCFIIWLRFGKTYWRDKLALERRWSFEGSAPCWIRCFNTWWERKKEIVCGLCFSNLCVKIGYDAQLSD